MERSDRISYKETPAKKNLYCHSYNKEKESCQKKELAISESDRY